MKTLNLFLKIHFTSLSPDGQCISLAIVTDTFINSYLRDGEDKPYSKSFYAEFSDFDINRCDDWVKENIVSKLNINLKYKDPREDVDCMSTLGGDWKVKGGIYGIKYELSRWLSQFSDYKLNFVVDCGWFAWYKFVELVGEWEVKEPILFSIDCAGLTQKDMDELQSVLSDPKMTIPPKFNAKRISTDAVKTGLPKLPVNFPPVPQDLNELIAYKKGISVSEAFDLDREDFIREMINDDSVFKGVGPYNYDGTLLHMVDLCRIGSSNKFNSLWDCKVTKAIYEKLK